MTHLITDKTRERMSQSAKRRCTEEWRKAKSDEYSTPLDSSRVAELYNSGLTQKEVGEILGVSQKVIWNHMKNHGIPSRKAAKRNQNGHKNHMWKGENASYGAKHMRVYSALGKASDFGCSICGRNDSGIMYDWANLSGDYDDISDYAPMCRACHRKYDKKGGDVNV